MLLPRSIVANVVTDAGDGEGGVPLNPLEAAEGPLGIGTPVEEQVIYRVDCSTDGDQASLRSDGALGVVEEGRLALDGGQHVDVTHDPVPDRIHGY